jgi:hypothetical protein
VFGTEDDDHLRVSASLRARQSPPSLKFLIIWHRELLGKDLSSVMSQVYFPPSPSPIHFPIVERDNARDY